MSSTLSTLSLALEQQFSQLPSSCYEFVAPTPVKAPHWIAFNAPLAAELGLDAKAFESEAGLQLFSGNELPTQAKPLAMAYAGHQFGHFNPQLGDGRAILLAEVRDKQGALREIQLKGAGPTPYSRRGDGRSALGPALREYLVSEAFFALGVPTTRALAVVGSGEKVWRDPIAPGAIFTRVARSHLRIGSLEYFAARRDLRALSALVAHALRVHQLTHQAEQAPSTALLLFEAVIAAQATLVAKWLSFGFIHGVMNTDNMSLSGETIDYGPCAFMDHYRADQCFSSIDRHGRYAYDKQPRIAHWNLARLAEALLPLILEETKLSEEKAIEAAQQKLAKFQPQFQSHYQNLFAQKLGFPQACPQSTQLAKDFFALLEDQSIDFTLAFHYLSHELEAKNAAQLEEASKLHSLFPRTHSLQIWLQKWREALKTQQISTTQAVKQLRQANPVLIARNHQIQAAITQAEQGNYTHFHYLHRAWQKPYEEQEEFLELQNPPLAHEQVRETFCGT